MPRGAHRWSPTGDKPSDVWSMHERLRNVPGDFDVIVVGGGINGVGVARDAALRGFRTALVEQHDFGSGSSSRTSKLVHGGIRYLEHGAFRLVWEASQERRRLLHLAPHLVHPQSFVFPVYRDSRIGPWRLRAGLWLYDLLAAFRNIRPHRMLALRDASRWHDGLRVEGLRGAGMYWDAAMDDARLVLANARGARAAGAVMLARAEASLRLGQGRVTGIEVHDLENGERAAWSARLVVACTGPWSNAFLGGLPGGPRPLATTRGTHIVVRRLAAHAFTLAAGRDGRVFFVLPWLGATLIGTTDLDDDTDPDRVSPSDEEIDYLLAEANRFFPDGHLARTDVLSSFAGLRPLLRASGDASARSREHQVLEPLPGLLAVVGGKYTTYRVVAESVVDRIAAALGRRGRCRTRTLPLPGGDVAWSPEEQWCEGPTFARAAHELARRAAVDEATARRWWRTYGSDAPRLAALAAADGSLGATLCAHHSHTRAEVVYAVREEMALRLEDWFLRRSRTAFTACRGVDAVEAVAGIFAAELGWDTRFTEAERQRCEALLRDGRSPVRSPTA